MLLHHIRYFSVTSRTSYWRLDCLASQIKILGLPNQARFSFLESCQPKVGRCVGGVCRLTSHEYSANHSYHFKTSVMFWTRVLGLLSPYVTRDLASCTIQALVLSGTISLTFQRKKMHDSAGPQTEMVWAATQARFFIGS